MTSSSYVIISGDMLKKLTPRDNRLIIYAYLYGLTKNCGAYIGSIQNLSTKLSIDLAETVAIVNDLYVHSLIRCENQTTGVNGTVSYTLAADPFENVDEFGVPFSSVFNSEDTWEHYHKYLEEDI